MMCFGTIKVSAPSCLIINTVEQEFMHVNEQKGGRVIAGSLLSPDTVTLHEQQVYIQLAGVRTQAKVLV